VPDIATLKDIMFAIKQLHKRISLRDFMEEEYATLVSVCKEKLPKGFWPWLGSKLEILARDDSARLLFNEYYLGVATPANSRKLLCGQQEGTVVLRFATAPAPHDFCFVIDSLSKGEIKQEAITIPYLDYYGNLSNLIKKNLEETRNLMPISPHVLYILPKENCDYRSGPQRSDLMVPPYLYPKFIGKNPTQSQSKQTNLQHKPIRQPPELTKGITKEAGTIGSKPDLIPNAIQQTEGWSAEEVREWVRKCEDWEKLGLPQVPQQFFDQDVDGRAMLGLTQADLHQLGITKIGPTKRIMEKIAALKKQ